MTLTEIAVLLAQRLNQQFDSSFVAMTKDLIKLWDATITIQRLDSKPTDRIYFTQSIVLPLESVSEAECSQLGLVEECIMKTKEPIPDIIRTNVLFDYVGAENFRNPYTMATPLELKYMIYERRKKPSPKFFERNKYIYTVNSKAEKIGITSIFCNPEQISLCNAKLIGDEDCTEDTVEYKRPNDIIQKIIQSISSVDFRLQTKDLNQEQIKPVNQ